MISSHDSSSTAPPGWFTSAAALGLMRYELREIIPILSTHIGVRGLFLRPAAEAPTELSGNMLQTVSVVHRARPHEFAGQARFADDALPFGTDSLSLICALHVLESDPVSLALVGEFARCLQPEGLLVVLNLSTGSPWRLRWRGSGHRPAQRAWMRHALDAHSLSVELQRPLGTLWQVPDPASREGGEAARERLLSSLCASQLWVARKRRVPLTPQRALRSAQVPAGMGLR